MWCLFWKNIILIIAAGANAHRITLMELKEFEENLHHHVHLENIILFPKAIKTYEETEPA
jgi:regulator of cell morphogenesis and NO signaling